jgi:origin recognition complex subunit 5
MISTLSTSQFRTTRGVGLDDALVIPFPRLSKEDALVSLELDAKALIKADERHTEPIEVLSRLHSAFIEVAYDSFASDLRDLEEIRLMACCVWYPFIEPLLLGAVEVTKTQALLSRSSYLFRDALTRLHTREICPTEWVIQMVNRVKTETQANSNQITTIHNSSSLAKSIAIPLIPSFLLLASFLASYNPARLDVSYFVRDESALLPEANDQRTKGLSKKRKRITRRKGAGGGSGQNRQEMLGPKTFALDRLLSIFQSLMTEAGPEVPGWMGEEESQVKSDWWEVKSKSTAVMEATNTLIRMGFLVRTSAAERLEGTTLLRTNVTFEAISQVSRRVKFDLQEWLWDWNQ